MRYEWNHSIHCSELMKCVCVCVCVCRWRAHARARVSATVWIRQVSGFIQSASRIHVAHFVAHFQSVWLMWLTSEPQSDPHISRVLNGFQAQWSLFLDPPHQN